jgi:hypothetical protein
VKQLALASAWVLLVALGAAKLWEWAWASVSGTPLVEPHHSPTEWTLQELGAWWKEYCEEW